MTARVRVKICGITNGDDARLAVELGADALGFIFFPRSPRVIDPAAARAIIDALPPFVTPVAVLVNETAETIHDVMTRSGCRVAQLHGDESPALLDALSWPVVKGLPVRDAADLAAIARYPAARAILLDTKVTGEYGGTGATFDWTLAREAHAYSRPLILAGGLTPENVTEAIRIAQPHAVDVSSGVEAVPGHKDPEKLRRLFAAITGGD